MNEKASVKSGLKNRVSLLLVKLVQRRAVSEEVVAGGPRAQEVGEEGDHTNTTLSPLE